MAAAPDHGAGNPGFAAAFATSAALVRSPLPITGTGTAQQLPRSHSNSGRAGVTLRARPSVHRDRCYAKIDKQTCDTNSVNRIRIPPMRILAVTGSGATAFATAPATLDKVGQSLSKAEPPFFATLC